MPMVGQQLQQAREAQGLTIYDVADATKIKTEHVRALEAGDYDAFAAPIYIRGFVRTYATLLKIDLQAVMADLDGELSKTERFREAPPLSGPRQGFLERVMFHLSRLNWQIVAPVLALIFFLLIGIWGFRKWQEKRHADPLRDLGPGLHQSTDPSSQTLPLPSNKPKK